MLDNSTAKARSSDLGRSIGEKIAIDLIVTPFLSLLYGWAFMLAWGDVAKGLRPQWYIGGLSYFGAVLVVYVIQVLRSAGVSNHG